MGGGVPPKSSGSRARNTPRKFVSIFRALQICRDPYRGHALQQLAGSKLMLALMSEHASLNLWAALNSVLQRKYWAQSVFEVQSLSLAESRRGG